jgi:hypothetical protein
MASSRRFAQLGAPLFDLDSYEVLVPFVAAIAVVNAAPMAAAPIPKDDVLIEDLTQTPMSKYVIDSEDGDQVYLQSGYEISVWSVVAEMILPYGIRLPDGRLIQYVGGSSRRLFADSERLRCARRVMGGVRSEGVQEAV